MRSECPYPRQNEPVRTEAKRRLLVGVTVNGIRFSSARILTFILFPISFVDAALGGDIKINTVDGDVNSEY